jgi:hypothetical protein
VKTYETFGTSDYYNGLFWVGVKILMAHEFPSKIYNYSIKRYKVNF